jgi:hypothetical protein
MISFKHDVLSLRVESTYLLVSFCYKVFIYDVQTLKQIDKIYTSQKSPYDIYYNIKPGVVFQPGDDS